MSMNIYSLAEGLILIILCFCQFSEELSTKKNYTKIYEDLVEWGKKEGVYISKKIKLNMTDENNRYYYPAKKLDEDETLFRIPINATIYSERVNELLKKNKKIQRLYKKIRNKKSKQNSGEPTAQKLAEETFVTSVLYLVNNEEKFFKNKFVKNYGPFLKNFETDVSHFPYFFTKEQRNLFQMTSFGSIFDLIEKNTNDEAKYLVELLGQDIDMDEFAKYSSLASNKGMNIANKFMMIPFIDMLLKSPQHANVNITFEEDTQDIRIYTIKEIKKGENLYFVAPDVQNIDSFWTYGTTYEEQVNKVDHFSLPPIIPAYLEEQKLDKRLAKYDSTIDITKEGFYKKALKPCQDFLKKAKMDWSETGAMKFFVDNMKFLRRGYDLIYPSKIYQNFVSEKSTKNALRLMETEIKYMDKKIKEVEDYIEELKHPKKSKKNKEKKDEDEELNLDL